jgi:hypothetical protein
MAALMPHVQSQVLKNNAHLFLFDVELYAHKFTFPPPGKTAGEVHDRLCQRHKDQPVISIGYGPDFAVLRSKGVIMNIPRMVRQLREEIEGAGISGGAGAQFAIYIPWSDDNKVYFDAWNVGGGRISSGRGGRGGRIYRWGDGGQRVNPVSRRISSGRRVCRMYSVSPRPIRRDRQRTRSPSSTATRSSSRRALALWYFSFSFWRSPASSPATFFCHHRNPLTKG